MAERMNADAQGAETTGKGLKRRGILAAAAAVVAGLAAKQTSQPVAAAPITADYFFANGTATTGVDTTGGTFQTGVTGVGSVSGVYGSATGPVSFGVYGTSTGGAGVYGTTDAPVGSGRAGVVGSGNGIGVLGDGVGGTGAVGVQGQSANGIGGSFAGGLAPLRLVPAPGGTGAPTAGAHTAGELFVDGAGSLFSCKTSGTPGTWIPLGGAAPTPAVPTLVTLPTPERFVDTRSNLGGVQGPVPANATRTFQMTGRVGQSGNAALIIPDTARTLVGNLTVVGADGIPLGSFVTLWPGGAQPTVSTINYGPAATSGAIANAFVVGLGSAGGHGVVQVFNLSQCQYILDVTGYYG